MNQRIALYAGSFDPFTNGHLDIVRKASALFDRVVVMIGVNLEKRRACDAEAMRAAIQRAADDEGLPAVAVIHTGLVAEYCLEHGADTKQVRYVKVDGYSSISALSHLMRIPDDKCSSVLRGRIAELLVRYGADLYFGEEHLLGNGKLDRLTLAESMIKRDAPLRHYDFIKKIGYSPAKEPFPVI